MGVSKVHLRNFLESAVPGAAKMELSRRNFLKGTVLGGSAFSALGFICSRLRSDCLSQDFPCQRNPQHLSLLCCQLWRNHLHPGRQGQKRNSSSPPRRRRSRPSHQRGTLCPKGSSLEQDILDDRRLLRPQVRRPGATDWEDITWDQAYAEIAQKVKKTRDDTFIEQDANGKTVNRCEGIAFTGGCTDTNEFNYLAVKSMRSLGVCYLENQARV